MSPKGFSADDDIPEGSGLSLNKRSNTKNNNAKLSKIPKNRIKPSSEDSKCSTIYTCGNKEHVKEAVAKLALIQKKKRLNFNPIMIVHLDESDFPSKFFVFVDHLYMVLSTFKQCLVAYLKSFYVYDVEYPKEGKLVCLFLEEVGFGIDSKDAKIKAFIRDMKKELELEGKSHI